MICLIGALVPFVSYADEAELVTALRNTYTACVGIDDALYELKKMAGINTAITGVGTGLGAGATIVGIVKAGKDAEAKKIADTINYSERPVNVMPNQQQMDAYGQAYLNSSEAEDQFKKLREQSKKLGNWRTGLLAGNTATNVAGVIISSKNRVDGDLEIQIGNCKAAIANLRRARTQARVEGLDIKEADAIVEACAGFETTDVSKINSRAKGATISSAVGVATGLTGTITSAVANSESVRKDSITVSEKTNADWNKEKNLNTTANMLAGASTVASGVATVFNATQIKAIKDVAEIAQKCTGVLK